MTVPEIDPITTALMQARQAQKLSLLEVGSRMGRKTAQSVWQWENVTRSPSLINVHQWARALGFKLVLAEIGCEAQPGTRYHDPGWTCTGRNLVQLLLVHRGGDALLPLVAPADRLDEVMAQPWAGVYEPQPFAGGDHVHVVIKEAKP